MTRTEQLKAIYRQLPDADLVALQHGLNRAIGGLIDLSPNELEIRNEVIEQITFDRSMIEAANRKSGGKT